MIPNIQERASVNSLCLSALHQVSFMVAKSTKTTEKMTCNLLTLWMNMTSGISGRGSSNLSSRRACSEIFHCSNSRRGSCKGTRGHQRQCPNCKETHASHILKISCPKTRRCKESCEECASPYSENRGGCGCGPESCRSFPGDLSLTIEDKLLLEIADQVRSDVRTFVANCARPSIYISSLMGSVRV